MNAGENVKIFCKSEKHATWEFQDGPLVDSIYISNVTTGHSFGYFVHWILIFNAKSQHSGEYSCSSTINSRLVQFKTKVAVYGKL